ncbi:pyrroline-5-carboxylate reductase [Sphingomonas jatrophae]|uniref:Pyrroline-5-carboxylate reductase n=1 Tax=Sphingomonas jatrophae TaxID=1166337 RepID=A0A1I6KB10_9SPHN|nr:pyrroline-5-carboxylate reductase [Sphingomonas jatrophae]SFR88344.1 pyrroline-5-carboxylate reductase [Sphingomonas jatrophae]
MNDKDLLLVGCGNMGGAMLRGWLREGMAGRITVLTPHPQRVPPDVTSHATVDGIRGEPRTVVLAVKPQILATAAPSLQRCVGPGTILLSVLAAVDLATLRRAFPRAGGIVRAVPNLPAAIGEGATALAGDTDEDDMRAELSRLCASFGTVEWLSNEAALDAATSVSGCGPAFLFRFAEAVVQAGASQGLAPDAARRLFAQTMLGAARLLGESDATPAELVRRVASPGGVTLAGLAVLDEGDALTRLVGNALASAATRNAEMAAKARD